MDLVNDHVVTSVGGAPERRDIVDCVFEYIVIWITFSVVVVFLVVVAFIVIEVDVGALDVVPRSIGESDGDSDGFCVAGVELSGEIFDVTVEIVFVEVSDVTSGFNFAIKSSTEIMTVGIVVDGNEVVVDIVVVGSSVWVVVSVVDDTVVVDFCVVGCVLEKVTPFSSK